MDLKRSVALELDTVRHLRFGTNAIIEFEELSGKSITALDTESISFKELRTLFYVGLVHEDKNLNLKTVGDLIDDGIAKYGMETLIGKIGEALELALPEKKA